MSDLCQFDINDPYKNLDAYDRLAASRVCPHIDKTSRIGPVDVYALMDSQCHRSPSTAGALCEKPESDVLRLIAREEIENTSRPRTTKPLIVSCDLTCYHKDLLTFVGGKEEDETHVLRDVRIAVPTFYAKAHNFTAGKAKVVVEKTRDFELQQALVHIGATVSRGNLRVGSHKQPAELQIAIPPASGDAPKAALPPDGYDTGDTASNGEERPDAKAGPASDKALPINIFFSYSHEDELMKQQMVKHLSVLRQRGLVEGWHDRDISAGSDWAHQIDEHLDRADIILLLVSVDFLGSEYVMSVEVKRAMERNRLGKARVIPILLREVHWEGSELSRLQALPSNGKPVTAFADRDEAFVGIAKGIEKVIEEIRHGHALPQPPIRIE